MFNLDLEDLWVFRVPKIYVMDQSIRSTTSALVHDLQETVGLFIWECCYCQKILSPKTSVKYNLQTLSHIPHSGLSRAACLLCICLGHFSLFSVSVLKVHIFTILAGLWSAVISLSKMGNMSLSLAYSIWGKTGNRKSIFKILVSLSSFLLGGSAV